MNQINPTRPNVGGSDGAWGSILNTAIDAIVAQGNASDLILKPATTPAAGRVLTSDGAGNYGYSAVPGSATVQLLTIGTAAANTTAINNALAAAGTAGGGQVVLGPGVWHHTGIVFPAGGYAELRGTSVDGTVLYNDSTTAASVTVAGAGGNGTRPYALNWGLRTLTLTAASITSGQIGVKVSVSALFELSNVAVSKHDTAFYFDSAWEFLAQHCLATSFGIAGYRFFYNSANAGSTPVTFVDCHAITGNGPAVLIDDNVNALTWVGGDILGTSTPFKILGSTTRLVKIDGTNFEGNTGADVQIGSSTTTPGNVTIVNTRHHHGGTTGNTAVQPIAIDHQNGGIVQVIGSYFSGYTTCIKQTNVTSPLIWQGINGDNYTNLVQGVVSSTATTLSSLSGLISPSGYITNDAVGGIVGTNGIKLGAAGVTGPRLFSLDGFDPYAGLGAIGDFCLRGGGAAGGRLFMKTTATVWTPIDLTNTNTTGTLSYGTNYSAASGSITAVSRTPSGATTLNFAVLRSTAPAGGDAVLTLPAGFRPSSTIYTVAGIYNGSAWIGYAVLFVSSNGVMSLVYVSTTPPAGSSLHGSLPYVS